MLPLLGPSDIRDAAGLVPDHFMTIDSLISNQDVQLGLGAVRVIDRRTQLLSFDAALDSAFDPYALARSVWFQRRDYKVNEDHPSDDSLPGETPPPDSEHE